MDQDHAIAPVSTEALFREMATLRDLYRRAAAAAGDSQAARMLEQVAEFREGEMRDLSAALGTEVPPTGSDIAPDASPNPDQLAAAELRLQEMLDAAIAPLTSGDAAYAPLVRAYEASTAWRNALMSQGIARAEPAAAFTRPEQAARPTDLAPPS